ncbi:MAG: Hsp20 family protein [Micavibrio sp.]
MNTTRLTLFDHPFFLGFDHIEREFERLKKSSDGYPPYNVEQTGDHALRITLAVAGFRMSDLDIEVDNNQLTIRGKQEDDKERLYLHRGIAARQFQRSFMLADGIKVIGATLDSGLLHIDMQRIVPQSTARKIEIRNGAGSQQAALGEPEPIDVEVSRKGESE